MGHHGRYLEVKWNFDRSKRTCTVFRPNTHFFAIFFSNYFAKNGGKLVGVLCGGKLVENAVANR